MMGFLSEYNDIVLCMIDIIEKKQKCIPVKEFLSCDTYKSQELQKKVNN